MTDPSALKQGSGSPICHVRLIRSTPMYKSSDSWKRHSKQCPLLEFVQRIPTTPAHDSTTTWVRLGFAHLLRRAHSLIRTRRRLGTRSMESPRFFLLLFLLLVLLPSTSSNPNPYPRKSFRSAEGLIRDLNLLPGIQDLGAGTEADDPSSPRLVERRLYLRILGESGSEIPVEQLGHHAGYYRLEHTHAAKY